MDSAFVTAYRVFRRDGAGALWRRTRAQGREILNAARFIATRHPAEEPSATLVDYAMDVSNGLIRPGQVRSEITTLIDIVRDLRPRTILEIGTARGGTFFLWCAVAHPEATAISVDLPGGLHGGGYRYWRTWVYRSFARPRQQVHLLRADSRAAATRQRVTDLLQGRELDFLFIDGDHTYEGVRSDFRQFADLVRPGGIIAFHDICAHPPEANCQVDSFWNEVKALGRHQEIVENPRQGWAGIGVLHVDERSRAADEYRNRL